MDLDISKKILMVASLVSALSFGSKAKANDFLYIGSEVKGSAGSGITQSRSSSALEYNPANLIYTKKVSLRFDISSFNLVHNFVPNDPELQSTNLGIKATPFSLGLVYKYRGFAMGASFVPTGGGGREFVLNQQTDFGVMPMRIQKEQSSYRVSAGLAKRINKKLALGLSVQNLSESTATKVFLADDSFPILSSDEAIIDSSENGRFTRFIVGLKLNINRKWKLNFVYKNNLEKNYQGQVYNFMEGEDFQETNKKSFLPSEYGLGSEIRLGKFSLFNEIKYLAYSEGRAIENNGIGQEEGAEVDLQDVVELSLGVKAKLIKDTKFSLAVAYLPNYMGDGSVANEDATEPPVIGPGIGDFKAIDRSILAVGAAHRLNSSVKLLSSLNYVSGTRVVSDEFANPGTYDVSIWEFSLGTIYNF